MSLLNSRVQNIRAKGNLDKYEIRASQYGCFDLFKAQTDEADSIITQELKDKAFTSIGNTFQSAVIDYDSGISISNSRSATIADAENTSQMVTISFTTYSWGFTIVPAMYMNNEIAMEEDFNKKFLKYLYLFASTLDTAASANLSTNKTRVLGNDLGYTFQSNVVKARYTERENLLGDLDAMQAANDYYGQMHLVGNPGVMSIIGKLQQQGVSNDKNKQLEYLGKILHYSNRITNASSDYATGYIVPSGSVGVLTRVERDAILGTTSGTSHEWGITNLPILDIPCGTYYYESVGDFNAIAGAATADLTRSWKQHYGFSVDVAMVHAYNSDAASKASPAIKFGVAEVVHS